MDLTDGEERRKNTDRTGEVTNLDRERKKNLQEEAAVPSRERKSIDSDLEEEKVEVLARVWSCW